MAESLPELLDIGVIVERGAFIEVVRSPDHRLERGDFALDLALENAERLLANPNGEFERRLLRAAHRGVQTLAWHERPWPAQLFVMSDAIESVLLPSERGAWLSEVGWHCAGAAAIAPTARALQYRLACRQLNSVDANLLQLRALVEQYGQPEHRRELARASLEVALHVGDAQQVELAVALDSDSADLRRFAQAWSTPDTELAELDDDLAAALATGLYAGALQPELYARAVDDERLAIRHFGYVGLALVAIARHSGADAVAALDGVRATADQWGAALPLLRADRLDAEADLSGGRPAAALAKLDAFSERLELYFGRLASETIRTLIDRSILADRLGRVSDARVLADECWSRVREVERVDASVLEALAEFHRAHDRIGQAIDIARRWQRAVADDPTAHERAQEFERALIQHRYAAEIAQLEGRDRSKL